MRISDWSSDVCSSDLWVAGRVLAAFQTAVAGGLAVGSWIWGQAAETWGVSEAITVAAGANLLGAFGGRWPKLADFSPAEEAGVALADPAVAPDLNSPTGAVGRASWGGNVGRYVL